MRPPNLHATAVVLGDRGVIVAGASGSGKTALALALVERVRGLGQFARLVADDQVFLNACNGRLVCSAPEAIAGLVEIRGLGPFPVACEAAALVDLIVRLVPEGQAERFPEPASETLAGCVLPCLMLAERNLVAAVPAVLARLGLRPFG